MIIETVRSKKKNTNKSGFKIPYISSYKDALSKD